MNTTLIDFGLKFQESWEITKKSFEFNNGLYDEIIADLQNPANFHCNLEDLDTLNALNKSWGIYLFQIFPKTTYTFESMETEWDYNARIEKYTKFPKVCKSRFNDKKHKENKPPYPFYIGKSEKLGKRIAEHLTHRKDHPTYGLKLNGRKIKEQLVYSYWQLPPELNSIEPEIKQFLLQRIESKLRNRLGVWIGKQ